MDLLELNGGLNLSAMLAEGEGEARLLWFADYIYSMYAHNVYHILYSPC